MEEKSKKRKYLNRFVWWNPTLGSTREKPLDTEKWERFDSEAEFELFCCLREHGFTFKRQEKIVLLEKHGVVPELKCLVDFFVTDKGSNIYLEYKGGWAQDSRYLDVQLNILCRRLDTTSYVLCTKDGHLLPENHFAKRFECPRFSIINRLRWMIKKKDEKYE